MPKFKKQRVKILTIKNHCQVADQCLVAESFLSRFIGLIGTKELVPGQGLLLNPCNDIHMWFMSTAIDVVFIRRKEYAKDLPVTVVITSVKKNVRPWRLLPLRDGRAAETLELPVGTIERCDLKEGDELCIS